EQSAQLVNPMLEIIPCPACQRRLQLPPDFQAEVVQCPSCQTQFSPQDARPAVAPRLTVPVALAPEQEPPYAELDSGDDGAQRRLWHSSRAPLVKRPAKRPAK